MPACAKTVHEPKEWLVFTILLPKDVKLLSLHFSTKRTVARCATFLERMTYYTEKFLAFCSPSNFIKLGFFPPQFSAFWVNAALMYFHIMVHA